MFSFLIFADQKPLKPIKHNPRSIIEDKIKPVRHVRIERVIKPQNQRTDHCEEGYVDDCSGDGDCCPESWIGDGYPDCGLDWGCDLTCYDCDGGDCPETDPGCEGVSGANYLPLADGNFWNYNDYFNNNIYHIEVNEVINHNGEDFYNFEDDNGLSAFGFGNFYFAWNIDNEESESKLYAYYPYEDRTFLFLDFNWQSNPFTIYWRADSSQYAEAYLGNPQVIETELGIFENCQCLEIWHPGITDAQMGFCFAEDFGIVYLYGAWFGPYTLYETNVLDCTILGDINNDGEVNVIDIVTIVACILENTDCPCSDLDNDGSVNVLDVVMLVNLILSND